MCVLKHACVLCVKLCVRLCVCSSHVSKVMTGWQDVEYKVNYMIINSTLLSSFRKDSMTFQAIHLICKIDISATVQ